MATELAEKPTIRLVADRTGKVRATVPERPEIAAGVDYDYVSAVGRLVLTNYARLGIAAVVVIEPAPEDRRDDE